MTENSKQEISAFAKKCRDNYKVKFIEQHKQLIDEKVVYYNSIIKLSDEPEMTFDEMWLWCGYKWIPRIKLSDEPEMTFDEMADLLIEKLTTYRGKR